MQILNIDIAKLDQMVEEQCALLKDGLIATDVWESSTGLALAGFNKQPAAAALFNRMTAGVQETLGDSGLPNLNRYYILDLDGDHTVLLIRLAPDLLQGMLLATKKANMGLLLSIVVPKAIAATAAART
jgi:hypothetical protein